MSGTRIVGLLIVAFCLHGAMLSQIPNKLSYQGLLTGAGDGSYTLKFDVYDQLAGGTLKHTETFTGVSVVQGTFSVILGSTTTLPSIFTGSLFVEITATAGPVGPSYPITFSPRSELTSAPYSLAPWSVNGSSLFYGGGNVGIGVTNPSHLLEVAGDIGGEAAIHINNTANRNPILRFRKSSVNKWGLYVGDDTDDQFYFYDYVGGANRMVITNGGNVGIGALSPTNRLVVEQTNGNNYASHIYTSGLATGTSYGLTVSAGTDASDVSFVARNQAGSDMFIVKGNGNVGIGTAAPSGRFSVNGGQTNLLSLGSPSVDDVGYVNVVTSNLPCFGSPGGPPCAWSPALHLGGTYGVTFGIGSHSSSQAVAGVFSTGFFISKPLFVQVFGGTTAIFNRRTDDGNVLEIQRDGVTEGTVSVSGGTVSYNAFTGSHYAQTDESIGEGTLVTLTGVNSRFHNDPESEIIYGITTSARANDPACLGAYLGLQESSKPQGTENPSLVMAVGNGEMWVADNGADIGVGDYLISSHIRGHAGRDNAVDPVSYVVARAAEPVRWTEVVGSAGGAKHKKISVFFESFAKTNASADTSDLRKTLEAQTKRIDELEDLVRTMAEGFREARHPSLGDLR
jgi:hypothetical protein